MQDLKEVTQDAHYENFRAARLAGKTPVERAAQNGEVAPGNARYSRPSNSCCVFLFIAS